MNNQWFGPAPFGPICDNIEKVETPVGEACSWCLELIAPEDSGIVMMHFDGLRSSRRPIHLECDARMLIGSLAHLQRRCSCFTGCKEAPLGMTKREEARRVWAAMKPQHRIDG